VLLVLLLPLLRVVGPVAGVGVVVAAAAPADVVDACAGVSGRVVVWLCLLLSVELLCCVAAVAIVCCGCWCCVLRCYLL